MAPIGVAILLAEKMRSVDDGLALRHQHLALASGRGPSGEVLDAVAYPVRSALGEGYEDRQILPRPVGERRREARLLSWFLAHAQPSRRLAARRLPNDMSGDMDGAAARFVRSP